MEQVVFTKVWVLRSIVGLVLTAITASGVAFAVSDYVVRANTASTAQTLEAILQANDATATGNLNSIEGVRLALETLNSTLQETNRAVGGLRDETTFLTGLQKDASGKITLMEADIDRIRVAVEGAGIAVNVDKGLEALLSAKNAGWDTIRTKYGISGDQPIFLEIAPSIEK